MTGETLDLKALCRLADVTPRTVHFYVQQGVLPPAVSRGPGARYSASHLERLRLIRRLQREHLPLAEIRQRLETMTDDDVATALAESATRTPPSPGESALDYVRGVLAQSAGAKAAPAAPASGERRPAGGRVNLLPSFTELRSDVDRPVRSITLGNLLIPASTHESAPVPPVAERSQWDRIVLATDVELHVRRPLTRDMNRRVERLLNAARDLLKET